MRLATSITTATVTNPERHPEGRVAHSRIHSKLGNLTAPGLWIERLFRPGDQHLLSGSPSRAFGCVGR